jgi:hypothetical protein
MRVFSWVDVAAAPVLVGLLLGYFAFARREKIDRTGPTDEVIEDLEDRGKIW